MVDTVIGSKIGQKNCFVQQIRIVKVITSPLSNHRESFGMNHNKDNIKDNYQYEMSTKKYLESSRFY